MEAVLVGSPGSAARSVGRTLAERRGARFLDLTGDPSRRPDAIAGIRLAEPSDGSAAIRRVIAADRIVADTAVRARLFRGRHVFWLDVPPDRLVERLRAARRADVEIEGDYRAFVARHLSEYLPYYAAGARVDASGSIAATIEQIDRVLGGPTSGGTLMLRAELHEGFIELGEGILEPSLVHVLRRLAVRRGVVVTSARARRPAEDISRVVSQAGFRVDIVELPEGEPAKILEYQEVLFRRFADLQLDRTDPLIALGDDALLEAATFSAAVWLRGVPLIAVPVTTLGLIDTSIGGKGGIDLPGQGRNLLGAFHQPTATILDVALVGEESAADRRAALAEAVKSGLVGDDRLLALLEAGSASDYGAAWPEATELLELVERCVLVKRRIVLRDERDTDDVRIALNLGHTLSHALEVTTGYRMRHGEAVAYGLRAALDIGVAMGVTPSAVAARARRLLNRLGLGQAVLDVRLAEVLDYIESDKKRKAGKLRWVLVGSGGVEVRDDIPPELVRAAVEAAIGGSAPSNHP